MWAAGCVFLKYLDESGFCLEGDVSYTWRERGKPKAIKQPKKRGRRISILGLWEPGKEFSYCLTVGGVKSKQYIEMLEWEAKKAEERLKLSGCITVIVLDNFSVHKSKAVQKHWEQWRKQGLYFFFLPPYSSELNAVELEWRQLKQYGLNGETYDDEVVLVDQIIASVAARGKKGNYVVDRYLFNSG